MKESDFLVKFENMEEEERLFDLLYEDIYIWPLIRRLVYANLRNSISGLNSNKVQSSSDQKIVFVTSLMRQIVVSLYRSCSFSPEKKDNLIFFNGRSSCIEGKVTDRFTDNLRKQFDQEKVSYNTCFIIKNKHFPCNRFQVYDDVTLFSDYVLNLFLRFFYDNSLKAEVASLNHILNNSGFNVGIDIEPLLKRAILRFKIQRYKYKKLLKKFKPTSVYLSCAYGFEGLVSVAKEMGIEVIEMQHGVINKFVIAYNVPDVYPSQYMPSKLYLFTSFFKSNLFHKSIKKKSFDFGLSYCKSEQKKVVVSNKETFDFLLVSQPSVPDFINFALEIAALNPSYSFTYKIHPRELLNSSLVSNISNSAPQNFKISMDSSISKLMTEVDCIICIRSLVAYEAIQCGVNVLLTSPFEDSPMPDIDHFDNVYTIPSMMAVNLSEYVDLMPKGQRADMSKNILC